MLTDCPESGPKIFPLSDHALIFRLQCTARQPESNAFTLKLPVCFVQHEFEEAAVVAEGQALAELVRLVRAESFQIVLVEELE